MGKYVLFTLNITCCYKNTIWPMKQPNYFSTYQDYLLISHIHEHWEWCFYVVEISIGDPTVFICDCYTQLYRARQIGCKQMERRLNSYWPAKTPILT